ncbi:MAG: AAA family ATPase [Clostridia bacterium]|nr:AAA family ATPase [Clostridia bacterium]
MIITVTGKPYSGKSVTIDYMEKEYGFDVVHVGELYRKYGMQKNMDVLELNKSGDYNADYYVDNAQIEIAKKRQYDEIIFDGRMSWHLLPESFKIFLDVCEDVQAKRLLGSKRASENTNVSFEEAKILANERWNVENERYQKLYNCDNLNLSNYDYVLDTSKTLIEDNAKNIFEHYREHKQDVLNKQLDEADKIYEKICEKIDKYKPQEAKLSF